MSEAESYIAKWLAREPGMELARVFCPVDERRLFNLWGALLNELDEAAFEVSETPVALAKLAWWGEDLTHGAFGAAQHPLLQEFFAQAAAKRVDAPQWVALIEAAIDAAQDEARPRDTEAALQRHRRYAEALSGIEAALLGIEAPSQAIAVHRVLRALTSSRPRWPLHLVARHQLSDAGDVAAARRDLARELRAALRQTRGGALFRRCSGVLDALRLERLASGAGDAGRLALLWRVWRAARNSSFSP